MTDKQQAFPARIHIIFANVKKLAVVIRRGPSKRIATFLWDRSNDRIRLGQWNSQTIFEKPLSNDWVLRKVAHEQMAHRSEKGAIGMNMS